jgi:branched-chain amino acid aminotransferase
METLIYIDGQIFSGDEAKLPILDLSILRGYGVFDCLRTYQKRPFHLWDHLKRFENSAKELEIPLPLSLHEIEDIVEKLLERAPYPEANIKICLTGGTSQDQYLPEGNPRFFALVYPLFSFPENFYTEGIALITHPYQRPYPTCKSIHYLPAILALRQAGREGAQDALFINDHNQILETGTANFFAIKGETLITTDRDIIFGITRKVVLEILKNKNISVEERPIGLEELSTCDGAFITSTTKQIVPVVRVGSYTFNLHPLIKTLMEDFATYVTSGVLPQSVPVS